MSEDVHKIRRVLRSTALCSVLAMLAMPAFAQTFDPDEGSVSGNASTPLHRRAALPSTAPLMAPQPKLIFAPVLAPVQAPAPVAIQAVPVTTAPQFPPVDPAVAAQAQQEMAAHPSYIAAPPSFTAPAPLTAQTSITPLVVTPVLTKPVAIVPLQPMPGAIAMVPAEAPFTAPADTGLSNASKSVLHKLPTKLSNTKPPVGGKLDVSRMSPTVKDIGEPKVQSYDAVGLSIKVARPGIDTNFELNRAYDALMGGDTLTAINSYQKILTEDPTNQDALFGLASTYHRNGELDKARPYYAQLLKENPTNRDGLNNFLALVSEESPEAALVELERLEEKNPDFSPIPAQESIVLSKLGYFEQARDKLLRAIKLAPENLTYKYNLAVMFDRHGDYGEASALYHMLIDASLSGAKLPATTETLQKRLNYITSAAASAAAGIAN